MGGTWGDKVIDLTEIEKEERTTKMSIALATIVHDTTGDSIPYLDMIEDQLVTCYSELFITISNETSPELKHRLEKSAFRTKVIPKRGVAHARRSALEFGLSSECDHLHCCDFDRLLTWSLLHNEELKKAVGAIENTQFIVFGRTMRAFLTHPIEWIETESIVNRIFSMRLGMKMDITAGSCGLSKKSGAFLTTYSNADWTDAEWPLIIRDIAKYHIDYCEVDGLEYREELSGDRQVMEDVERWFRRLEQAYRICSTMFSWKPPIV